MARGEEYVVTRYDPIQVAPCHGIRSVLKNNDDTVFLAPVIALAVCRVRRQVYCDGVLVRDIETYRQVCGIEASDEGLKPVEECVNLIGYIGADEDPDEWLRVRELVLQKEDT